MSLQRKRLSKEKNKNKGVKGIFGKNAKKHEKSVNRISRVFFEELKKEFPRLEFRFRTSIKKEEINKKLNSVDSRLGVLIFVEKASIKPDGGIIEVKDDKGIWHIVLICEAKHQGNDIDNIRKGILVGKNKNQELMLAGNAIERSHKNINELRNMMIDEKYFPYILFLEGSNFLVEPFNVIKPDGTEIILSPNLGILNRIDRLTASNYSLPINQNSCENIFINIEGKSIMLQAVSIFTKPTEWSIDEIKKIMKDISYTSLKIIGLLN